LLKKFYEYRNINDTRVKSLTARNACIPVEARLYDPPQYEHEVVRKRHENANMGQIVGARSAEQSGIRF